MTTTQEVLVASPKDSRLIGSILAGMTYADFAFSVQVRETGSEVLAYLRENTPTVMLLDASLEEITGTSIAYRAKRVSRLKDCGIVLLVDANKPKVRADAEMCNVEQVLYRPFHAEALKHAVSKLLELRARHVEPEITSIYSYD